MTFPCVCPACEHTNHVEWSRIGREMFCGACGKPFNVPAPMETVPRKSATKDLIKFRCPACGKKYSTTGKLMGQKIRCKGCGGGVRVPGGEPTPASNPASIKPPTSQVGKASRSPSAASEAASNPAPAGRASQPASPELNDFKRAPASNSQPPVPVSEGLSADDHESVDDMLPILEDSSLLDVRLKKMKEVVLSSRTEAMARVSREVAEEEARIQQKKRALAMERARLKKKKRTGYFDPKETLRLVGWISAFVGVTAFLAWGYPEFRFPLGGVLCVTGFIVYLLGWASLKQLVAEEGAFRAIAFRFFPPYQWWFVWSRWSDAKDHAIFFAAGFLIMTIGSAVIKTSPTGIKAEKNERDYQRMLKKSNKPTAPAFPAPIGIVGEDE